jgi:site-specific DNA recombinase
VGYLNEPRLRTIVVDEAKAPLVCRMFEAYATGQYSLPQLRNLVASWGLVNRKGKPLTLSKMGELLSNPFFIGMFRWHGELYEGSHPPLISRKLFERVQEVLARSSRYHSKRKHLFPFIGLLRCGECGCAITAERQKGHHYYRCTKKKGPCSQRYIREEALAAQLRAVVQKVTLADTLTEKMLDKVA